MANGTDAPGGGGGSAPPPNNDDFTTPISPAPVTPDNAPAPMAPPPQAPPQAGASPMSMQPFPLDVGPPRDEDHFNERKAGWKRVFEQFQSNPALNSALLSFGTTLMQPAQMRGRGAQVGQLGEALAGGAQTYQAARQQQLAQAEQQRKAGLEERRVATEEKRTDIEGKRAEADVGRIKSEKAKLDLEIADMPKALAAKYKREAALVDEAIAGKNAHEATARLAELKYKLANDPEMQKAQLERIRAEAAEARARATAAQEGKNADRSKIDYLVNTLHWDADDAANLVLGHGTAITAKAKQASADQTAKDLLVEWGETGGKDERTGKPISFAAWKNQKMQDISFSSGGHADTGAISAAMDKARGAQGTQGAAPGADDPRVQAIVAKFQASGKTPKDRAEAAAALKALGINE